jgi:hypothetical protein
VPKKKRADVPAIRPQLDALPESTDDPFDGRYPPVRRGPAWELAVIEAAVEDLDREVAVPAEPRADPFAGAPGHAA